MVLPITSSIQIVSFICGYTASFLTFLPVAELKSSNLFNWLWPKILQHVLDKTIEEWNEHETRHQAEKAMPSGVSPMELWLNPMEYGKIPCGIKVENVKDIVDELRERLPRTREEVFRWVSDGFREAAEIAHMQIGSPELKLVSEGWQVFGDMLPFLEDCEYQYDT